MIFMMGTIYKYKQLYHWPADSAGCGSGKPRHTTMQGYLHYNRRCHDGKKVVGYIKLQIPAGKATPAPPVGPALGQHGVNIVEFTKQFNARTADKGDVIIPVVITVYADRSFSFITKTLRQPYFLRKHAILNQALPYRIRQRWRPFPRQSFRKLQR